MKRSKPPPNDETPALGEKRGEKMTWEQTYKDTARAREDWSDLEATLLDGLDDETW